MSDLDDFMGDPPPMPATWALTGTVRDFGSHEQPVARVDFFDVLGDSRTLDFTQTTALALACDLLTFVRQVHR